MSCLSAQEREFSVPILSCSLFPRSCIKFVFPCAPFLKCLERGSAGMWNREHAPISSVQYVLLYMFRCSQSKYGKEMCFLGVCQDKILECSTSDCRLEIYHKLTIHIDRPTKHPLPLSNLTNLSCDWKVGCLDWSIIFTAHQGLKQCFSVICRPSDHTVGRPGAEIRTRDEQSNGKDTNH